MISEPCSTALLQSERPPTPIAIVLMSKPFPTQSMTVRLFNTLTGEVDPLAPMDGQALRMYACGPTVYDYGHIGNFRTFIAVDLLYRFLRQSGYDVRYVMNITDVDDKIIRNAARDGMTVQEYTRKYRQAF